VKLWSSNFFQGARDVPGLVQRLTSFGKNLGLLLKNNVTFEDNMKCQVIKDFYFENNTTTYQIKHNLGVLPIGAVVIKQNGSGNMYWPDPVGEWNDKSIFVRFSTTNVTATILIIGA